MEASLGGTAAAWPLATWARAQGQPNVPPKSPLNLSCQRCNSAAIDLQADQERRAEAVRRKRFSAEKCAGRVLAVIAEYPDLLVASQPAEALH